MVSEQENLHVIIEVLKNWQKSGKTEKDFKDTKSALPLIKKTYEILCRYRGQCGAKTTDLIRWLGSASNDGSGYYPALLNSFASPEVISDLEKWQENQVEKKQETERKIYKGEEAWRKFEEKLSEVGNLEIPFYPFKAGKIQYWNLTGKSDIFKYGAYRFSKEDLSIIKNTVGSNLNISTLRAYLSAECNVQNPDNYSWKDILAALEHNLNTRTISKKEQEGMIEPKVPEILQKIMWILKYGKKHWKLVLIAGLFFLCIWIISQIGSNRPVKVNSELPESKSISDSNNLSSKTLIYENIRNRISDLEYKIIDEKISPWIFFRTGKMKEVTDYHGKVIKYSGIEFAGSPRLVFWDGFIEPFLENGIAQVLNIVAQDCQDRNIDKAEFLQEAKSLLAGLIAKTYHRMSEIDRRLRGKGYPEKVTPVDVSDKIEKMQEFLNQYTKAVLNNEKPPRKRFD